MYMSPQILELTGYTAEEYTADPDMWVKTLHPDDRVRAVAENVRHNETGDPFSLEYRLIDEDGPGGLGPRRGDGWSATSAGTPATRTA